MKLWKSKFRINPTKTSHLPGFLSDEVSFHLAPKKGKMAKITFHSESLIGLKSLWSLSHVQWKGQIYKIPCEFCLKGEKKKKKGFKKRKSEQLFYNWCSHLSALNWSGIWSYPLDTPIKVHSRKNNIVQCWCRKSFCHLSHQPYPYSVVTLWWILHLDKKNSWEGRVLNT